ncbi:MAG TPA: ABC transporter permease [Gemmatimonadaceae bacterium]
MGTLIQDIRYGLRMLARKPTFTIVAVVTLALGVGANTAIFSIVNAVLLRSLPYKDPDRLVRVIFNEPGLGLRDIRFSRPELEDLETRAGVFEDVTPIFEGSENLTGGPQPERVEAVNGSFAYFSMLGVTAQVGRLFGPQDYVPDVASTMVISDGLWRRAFGADPNVVGRTIWIDTDPFKILGVLPPGFRHPGPTTSGDVEMFGAIGFTAAFVPTLRKARVLTSAIARLKPGVTVEQAEARLTDLATQLRRDFPADYPPQAQWTIEIRSLQETLVGPVRPMLLVLLGTVILIVFIVSLNIANLLLARASGRQQEMAVRLALGASRGRIVRQLLTESLLLSIIGGVAGIATAMGTLGFILRFVPASIPRLNEVRIDWVVLAFALLLSVLTGLVFGLTPALQSARAALASAIREGGRGSGYGARTGRLRDVLIISELAFAVILMVGAGLLLRTMRDLLQQDPGFNPVQVVTANTWLGNPNDPKTDPYRSVPNLVTFDRELLRRIQAIPGVETAAITSALPTTNTNANAVGGLAIESFAIEDRPAESLDQDLRAERIRISPDYFKVFRATLLSGRPFTETDEDGKPPVAIIDESTARRYWPGRDPLGRRVRFTRNAAAPWTTIVGVIKDIKHDGLDVDGIPHIYVSLYQDPNKQVSLALRTSLPASSLEPQIRHEIQGIDPGLPVFKVASMNDVLDRSLAPRRFSADLVGGFAGLAVLLASIGIYGLLAYLVGQRSREIGIRMALGARPGDILKMFLTKGVALASVGILAGLVVAAASASLMASLLYGVRPRDPAVFLLVPALLLAVAVLASYLPALRATKVDPILALREG